MVLQLWLQADQTGSLICLSHLIRPSCCCFVTLPNLSSGLKLSMLFSTSADVFLRQPNNSFVLNIDDHTGFLVGFFCLLYVWIWFGVCLCFFSNMQAFIVSTVAGIWNLGRRLPAWGSSLEFPPPSTWFTYKSHLLKTNKLFCSHKLFWLTLCHQFW